MLEAIEQLRESVSRVYLGSPEAIDRLLCCLIAGGHALIEDVPGVGKTVLATALARSVDCDFTRVQMTPDLLPADLLGVSVYDRSQGEFVFKPGPIFTNILLADEINRASPRTQSALLEAMNEASVSADGVTRPLEQPFMVVATQNPHEFEGAYPLPENQLDRFLMRIRLGYPDASAEAEVLLRRPATEALPQLAPVLTRQQVIALREKAASIHVERSLVEWIVAIAAATRQHEELRFGLSPRGALALAQAARAWAVMQGRDYCVPEDVLEHFLPVCAHRVQVRPEFENGDGQSAERALEHALTRTPSPV